MNFPRHAETGTKWRDSVSPEPLDQSQQPKHRTPKAVMLRPERSGGTQHPLRH